MPDPFGGGASSRPGYRKPEECEKNAFFYFVNSKRFISQKVSKRKAKTEQFSCLGNETYRYQRNFLMKEARSTAAATTTAAAETHGQIRNYFKLKLLTFNMIIDRMIFLSQLYVGLSTKCENRCDEYDKLYQVIIGITRQQSNFIVLAFLPFMFMFIFKFCKNSSVMKINSYYNLIFAVLMCRVNKNILTLTLYCYFILMIVKWFNKIVLEKRISKSKVPKVGTSKQKSPRNDRLTKEK
jgi:hypothetical protein